MPDRSSQSKTIFRYSDEEWAEIAKETGCDDQVRGALEGLGNRHISRLAQPPETRALPPASIQKEAWERIALASVKLNKAVQDMQELMGIFHWFPIAKEESAGRAQRTAFEAFLAKLPAEAARRAERPMISVRDSKSNKTDFERNIYLRGLVMLWVHLGGDLKTSYNQETGEAGGHVVRFLAAAGNPFLKSIECRCPTNNALRQFVRDHCQWMVTEPMVD